MPRSMTEAETREAMRQAVPCDLEAVTIAMIDAGVGASLNAPAESTVAERFAAIYRAMRAAA